MFRIEALQEIMDLLCKDDCILGPLRMEICTFLAVCYLMYHSKPFATRPDTLAPYMRVVLERGGPWVYRGWGCFEKLSYALTLILELPLNEAYLRVAKAYKGQPLAVVAW